LESELHPTLKRQLKKLGLSPNAAVGPESVNRLLGMISRAYGDFDQERYLLDRSQNIASDEMNALNMALKDSQARLSSLLSLSSDWIWEQDPDGRFTFVSEELEPRTGVAVSTLLGQRCAMDGLLRVAAEPMERLVEDMSLRRSFRTVTFEVARADGELRYMQITGEPVFVASEFAGYRGVGSDITASVQAARRIEELARYDSLTGLPNRHMFMEELQRMLRRSERGGRSFAVMFIDLDRFKSINDTLGHSAGDELLQNISRRLGELLRKADVLARLGGDEFVVLTEDNPDAATLAKIACRVLSCINEPMQLEERRVEISASIGVACYPRDGLDEATLVQAADTAMYQAKARGKNTFEFFTEDMARAAASNFALEGDLRLAVERQQLELHYQAKVDAGTGELIGMEALIRWNHPERGLLAPGAFIELAEESGLIVPIGRWVLRTACAQMAAWTRAGLAPPALRREYFGTADHGRYVDLRRGIGAR
jgi:diguanylate cyclase (GGDEF)-like protein/PAS domain S-box-containing protein